MNTQILTVSTKGQVSLPIAIRKELDIQPGTKLIAHSSGDSILLKIIKLPTEEEFKREISEMQTWAAEVGYSEDMVSDIIKQHRRGN